MKKSASTNSKSNNIKMFNETLMSKLHQQQDTIIPESPPTQNANEWSTDDCTSSKMDQLLIRAKTITSQNQGKIEQAKTSIRVSNKDKAGTFLTGVGLYTLNEPEEVEENKGEEEIDPDAMLKDLMEADYDDLAELRKMIKQTNRNLNGYGRSVYNTQVEVIGAAEKFNKHVNIDLSRKINKCELQQYGQMGVSQGASKKPSKTKPSKPLKAGKPYSSTVNVADRYA